MGRALARGLWNTTVRGLEHVPATGPAIIVGNHTGLIDGPLVHGVLRRGSHFLITTTMFKGVLKPLLTAAAQIPVDPTSREALARAMAVLKRGDLVGIFPEGSRGMGTVDSVRGGAAWLAVHSDAVVVPCAIFGTRRTGEGANVWPPPRRRILVEFGHPVSFAASTDLSGRARQERVAQLVAARLREHVAQVAASTDIPLPTDDPHRPKENS